VRFDRTFLLTSFALSLIAPPYLVAQPQEAHAATTSAWARHVDPKTGLSVYYPKDWKVDKTADGDVLFKIEGISSDGYTGAFEVHETDMRGGLETVIEVVEKELLGKQQGYKKLASGTTQWGRSARFSGPWSDVTFKIGAMPVHQRWYYFRSNNRNHMLVFTAPEQGFARLLPTFNQILSTFETGSPVSTASASAQRRDTRPGWQLTPLQETSHIPLKMAYPTGWTVKRESHGEERSLKFAGKNHAGMDAEMNLWVSPRGEMTLDQFVELAEQEHLKPLPGYCRLRTSHRTVNGLDAVSQSASFLADGIPGKMDTVFFVDRDRVYCLGLMSATWSPEEMRDLVDRVAASIKF
jgi:hypothetical protein